MQYIRRRWMNRNGVHHPKESVLYISVPIIKHARITGIKDIVISDDPKQMAEIVLRELEC